MRILIIPGLNGSGPGHWQTLWEEKYNCERVEQRNWADPDLVEWVNVLNACIALSSERTVLVAHSLGCFLVGHWAHAYPANTDRISNALLVAPPNVKRSPQIPESLRRFAVHKQLSFPSLLVGSENDPLMTLEDAKKLATDWGSAFFNAGFVGHINLESGHGPWPQGETLLTDLIKAHVE